MRNGIGLAFSYYEYTDIRDVGTFNMAKFKNFLELIARFLATYSCAHRITCNFSCHDELTYVLL